MREEFFRKMFWFDVAACVVMSLTAALTRDAQYLRSAVVLAFCAAFSAKMGGMV